MKRVETLTKEKKPRDTTFSVMAKRYGAALIYDSQLVIHIPTLIFNYIVPPKFKAGYGKPNDGEL